MDLRTIPAEMYENTPSRVISETERLHKLTESMLTLNSLDAKAISPGPILISTVI
ncbi:MAG: hypothetical protein ACLR0U_32530 [Enterocloster clostridioformis]